MEIPIPGQQSFHPVSDADSGDPGIVDDGPAYPRSSHKTFQDVQKVFGFPQKAVRR